MKAVVVGADGSLILVGIHYPDSLEDAHRQIWQPAMAIAAIGLWLLWQWRVSSATTSMGNAGGD